MFHKAINLKYLEGTELEVTFQDGKVMHYDMARLFTKYPQLEALKDRKLFLSGRLYSYGIRWNDELDIEAETIYQEGEYIRTDDNPTNVMVAYAVSSARAEAGISQASLAAATGIDQADISKIENGLSNPSVSTLHRIAKALDMELSISIK